MASRKKGDGVAEDQHKQRADGPTAADEIQNKKRNMIRSENVCFFHDKENGVMFFSKLVVNIHL